MNFEYAYDLGGTTFPIIQAFDILDATAIKKGELVRLTDGYIVPAGTDYTTPYTGVAVFDKAASDGVLRMKVYTSPTAVFKCDPILTTVSASPSATVWTDTVTLLDTTANDGKGGKLKIKALAAGATGTYPPNKIIPLTASATGTLTGSFPGSTTVGDTALFFPPINKLGATATANNGIGIVWASTTGTALRVIDHDLENNKVLVQLKLHGYAN